MEPIPEETDNSAATVRVAVFEQSTATERDDSVAVEEPLEIQVSAGDETMRVIHPVAVTMRTPGADRELALGFLRTEGAIVRADQVEKTAYQKDDGGEPNCNVIQVFLKAGEPFDAEKFSRHVFTSSSCGICGRIAIERVRAETLDAPVCGAGIATSTLAALPGALRRVQRVFETTGGLHASALFDLSGRLLLVREDVGRHNALDKIIGALLAENRLPAGDTALLLSGRASFELIQKAAIAGVPIVAAVGAPSSLAVELAKELGITLVGFLKGSRFNVYAGRQRILE